MKTTWVTRRTLMQSAAAAATLAGVPLAGAPFVRGAHAAGKLSVAVWDHWVPGANDVLEKLCHEWAAKEKVEITIDFVTSQGDKLMLMGAAEGQARSGHDVVGQPSWYAAAKADMWEPADDMMATLIGKYGKPSAAVEYLGKQNGHWIAVPSIPNTLTLPSVGRIDLFKQYVGLDLTKMYPAGAPPDKELTDNWTWDFWLQAAGKCHKAGFPFGMPLGQTGDSMNWVGAIFAAHGAEMVDKEGNITVKSDATKHMLDFFKKLVPLLPDGVFAWDEFEQQQGADLRPERADHEFRHPPGPSLCGMRRRSPSSAGTSRRRRDRRVGSIPHSLPIGGSGISRPTNRPERACCCICGRRTWSRSWSPAARAMTSRRSELCGTSRPGPMKARQRAGSGTTRRAAM